jgi:DNA-directed RNA polymerase III subunit RPC8
MAVFRPFRGEIIYGRIKSSNEEGIILDLEFTSEVFVPYQNLPENSSFSKAEMVWIWNSEGTELFFDKGEPVLFRVEHEEWYDQRPTIVEKDEKGEIVEERPTAWKIIVSRRNHANLCVFLMCDLGLDGPTWSWPNTLVGRRRRRGGRGR